MEEMKKVLTREEAEQTKEKQIRATEDLYATDAAWEEDLKEPLISWMK